MVIDKEFNTSSCFLLCTQVGSEKKLHDVLIIVNMNALKANNNNNIKAKHVSIMTKRIVNFLIALDVNLLTSYNSSYASYKF